MPSKVKKCLGICFARSCHVRWSSESTTPAHVNEIVKVRHLRQYIQTQESTRQKFCILGNPGTRGASVHHRDYTQDINHKYKEVKGGGARSTYSSASHKANASLATPAHEKHEMHNRNHTQDIARSGIWRSRRTRGGVRTLAITRRINARGGVPS